MHCIESGRFLGNAYRNVSIHTATNLQSTVTAKNAITLLLKDEISIRFKQNLPQGENCPTENRIKQNTEEGRTQKKKKKKKKVRSEVFSLCGVIVRSYEVL
jgi:hypothetical protein